MAVANLLTLLDDIATVLDDVAVYSKLAAKKTAPVLGDDLAVNAEQVSGVKASREIPVVWAVAKGSFLNKLILVPLALLISAVYPPLIDVLLLLGGLFLCFEGAEKIMHKVLHKQEDKEAVVVDEKQKIKGAIRTDFILSAEIIVIALGAMTSLAFMNRVFALSFFAIAITVLVYGLVAGVVKLDDLGLYLKQKTSAAAQKIGSAILWFAPKMMKGLAWVGTLAMFLVGGGIVIHAVPFFHHLQLEILKPLADSGLTASIAEQSFILVLGFLIGLVIVLLFTLIQRLRGTKVVH